jgi:hypothetical protein
MRNVAPNLSGLIPMVTNISIQAFYQVLYRTTGTMGQPVAAMTSIFVPENADPNKLLAYQAFYNTANVDAVPSYAFRSGEDVTESVNIVFVRLTHQTLLGRNC